MNYYKNVCVIPAKYNSTRLKKKNLLKIGKKTLLENTIKKAKYVGFFDKIIVSTESKLIIKKISNYNKIDFFKRPKKLSKDPYTISDVLINIIENYRKKKIYFGNIIILLPTSPFFLSKDIKKSIKLFNKSKKDCLISISKTDFPIFNGYILKKNNSIDFCFKNSKYKDKKSTECPDTYKSNGGITIVKCSKFIKTKNLHSLAKIGYESKNWSFIDIDNLIDYKLSKLVFNKYFKKDNINFYV